MSTIHGEVYQLNNQLKTEADALLYDYGLLAILEKYGKPHVIGSYYLDTMTWRDLDIYLEVNDFDLEQNLNLGKEIGLAIRPHAMNYRNELIHKRPGFPDGVYWGIYTYLDFTDMWKIDLWIFDPEQVNGFTHAATELKHSISEEHREKLLLIKQVVCSHPRYFQDFKSMDIYDAVLSYGVTTVAEFQQWLIEKKGVFLEF
ncbi:hypothetical protein [Brevibacillus sp. SYSU BS000544]|uniref:hypothetical protein n=1 Tax=Brevibacillus sp. SYSU BS000544 TaxID=3416443 RepID=UPI003CE573F7